LLDGRVRLPRDLYLKAIRVCPLSATVTRHHQRRLCGILWIATRRTTLRNEGLFDAAAAMRDLIDIGVIDRRTATALLFVAAQFNGYVAKDGARAALATIRSGLTPTSANREASPLFGGTSCPDNEVECEDEARVADAKEE
jgi:hypothetical protein